MVSLEDLLQGMEWPTAVSDDTKRSVRRAFEIAFSPNLNETFHILEGYKSEEELMVALEVKGKLTDAIARMTATKLWERLEQMEPWKSYPFALQRLCFVYCLRPHHISPSLLSCVRRTVVVCRIPHVESVRRCSCPAP